MSLRLQVRLEPPEQGDAVPTLSLQRPVTVQSLHELALPGHRQITGDLTESVETGESLQPQHTFTKTLTR